jgi:hypothetical protein
MIRTTVAFLSMEMLVLSAGCDGGSKPAEDVTVVAAVTGSAASQPNAAVAPQIVGYQHTFANSLFKPGANQTATSDSGFEKLAGTDGVFAVDSVNGAVLAIPNSGAPEALRPRFPGSGDDHNAKVKQYFLQAGLPADQIGSVETHAMMQGGRSATGVQAPDTLVAYYSVISRVIKGVPVSESVAWARFNADGDVVEESVYWPPLPSSVVTDAQNVQAALDASASGGAMLQTIESNHSGFGNMKGRIVIHHGLSAYRGPAFAAVTYDSQGGASRRRTTRHFDQNGRDVTLAYETSSAQGTPRGTK